MSGPGRDLSHGNPKYNQNPSQFDKFLIKRSSPIACGDPSGGGGDYDLPFHIGSVFIILFVSASACAFPLSVMKVPCLQIPPGFLFIVRHFGTGVLLATAFAHLLPTAFISLTDPCLPAFWNEDYPAMAGVIALAAVFIVATVEMLFSRGRSCCASVDLQKNTSVAVSHMKRESLNEAVECCPEETACNLSTDPSQCRRPTGPMYGRQGFSRSDSIGQTLTRMITVNNQTDPIAQSQNEESVEHEDQITPKPATPCKKPTSPLADPELAQISTQLSPTQQRQKQLLQCLLLEIGILFHSIFIGMALAVATGNDFLVLLIAIAFHQTFEGLALGSRIATINWPSASPDTLNLKQKLRQCEWRPWLMAFAYGLTTPIGQVIGIATHTLYTPDSRTGLLMVGMMNAISAGLLTFTSLIDLLSEDFLSDESWRTLRGRKRVNAWALVFVGACGMSLIGAWA